MAKITIYHADLSRRSLLGAAACVVAGVAVSAAPTTAFAKKKRSQADVLYQDHPKGSERCDNCEPFIPPNACKTVEGVVAPAGWCKIYVKK